MQTTFCALVVALAALEAGCSRTPAVSSQESMDRDLMEITIPQLEQLYADHRYTVTEVVQWHVARIQKYNGIYRAVQNLDLPGALQRLRVRTPMQRPVARDLCAVPCGACRL